MSYRITTKATWSQTMRDLEDEFRKWGVSDWETNYPKGARSERSYQMEDDRTVTLRYKKNGKEVNLKYGKQDRAVDNLRALYLTINDMRMTEVRGVSDLVESAYKQLGNGSNNNISYSEVTFANPYEVLNITSNASLEVAEAAYRTLAKKYHPDSPTGSSYQMNMINEAIRQIRIEKND